MYNKPEAANQAQLQQLSDPASLAALDIIKRAGWLAVDAQALEKFFKDDLNHPAKLLLDNEARQGGKFAALQVAVLLSFTVFAILISSFQQTLSPTVFVLWGALGVCAGLLAAKYPARFFRKRAQRA